MVFGERDVEAFPESVLGQERVEEFAGAAEDDEVGKGKEGGDVGDDLVWEGDNCGRRRCKGKGIEGGLACLSRSASPPRTIVMDSVARAKTHLIERHAAPLNLSVIFSRHRIRVMTYLGRHFGQLLLFAMFLKTAHFFSAGSNGLSAPFPRTRAAEQLRPHDLLFSAVDFYRVKM